MSERKFIIVGESWMEILFAPEAGADDSKRVHAVDSYPGGLMLNVARTIASKATDTLMLTEIGNDAPGLQITEALEEAGVDTSFSDRYSVVTPIVLRFPDRSERYDIPAANEGFDITWPRVEEEDVVVFGGVPAVDARVHDRILQFVAHCCERKATVVYIPDVEDPRLRQITLVMPRVFECLEQANVVITMPGDLKKLYGYEDPERAYKNNLSFYCPRVVSIVGSEEDGYLAKGFGGEQSADGSSLPALVAQLLLSIPMPEPTAQ